MIRIENGFLTDHLYIDAAGRDLDSDFAEAGQRQRGNMEVPT